MNGADLHEGGAGSRNTGGARNNGAGNWGTLTSPSSQSRSRSQTDDGRSDAGNGARTRQLQKKLDRAGRRARGLGWFSVGLGVTQLLAPRALARAIGVGHGPSECLAMRAIGVRELMAGVGILSGRKPTRWVWSRVLGDVMDLALLGRAFRAPGPRKLIQRDRGRIPVALAAVAGVTALDFLTSRQLSRGEKQGVRPQVSRPLELSSVVTIDKSPEEVYAFWRDFQNLSRFMTRVESVQVYDQRRSRWTVNVGGKSLEWDAEITKDRANDSISWRTLKNADVANTGEVLFIPAAGGRGTEVRVRMEVSPPGGMLGQAAAKIGRKLPEQEIENDLRRLKQILEVGEVVHSDASIHLGPHPARPSASAVATAGRKE